MDHLEASRSQAAEKYLLGQLDRKARDEFEDHFFECGICAEDVRTGVLFADNAAAELKANPASSGARDRRRSWLDSFRIDWRHPAFAMPLFALLALTGLWMTDHARLRNQLQEPQAVGSVLVEHVRGATPVTAVREGAFTAVSFYIDAAPLARYTLKIEGNGTEPATVVLNGKPRDTTYNVLLPSARYKPGTYRFTIYGASETNAPIVGQFALNLE